jgi:transcriptional regulator with XRE-family HTH domain
MQQEIYGGGLYAFPARAYYAPMPDLSTKIRNLRRQLGLNQTELAERLKVTQASVSRWEKGSVPDGPRLAQLADLAGVSIKDLISDPESGAEPHLNRYLVRGEVAAGVWTVAYEWAQDEWYPYFGGAHIEVPEGSRFGLVARGESMDQIYPDGTILDCVRLDVFNGQIDSGQRVVVERIRKDGEIEATVKEYMRADDGKVWLVPRSNNPAFQAPIALDEPAPDIAEIRIVAVVVGSYRPE